MTHRTGAELFGRPHALVGMVHVDALPGTPYASRSVAEIADRAAQEAAVLVQAGFDAIIVENMHDRPYVHGAHPPQTVAAMTRAAWAVRQAAPRTPLGLQVLSGGNREALAIALATGATFIRCENFVFAHVADEGLLADAEAGPLLRYRRAIGGSHIAVLCDIKKKHASHAITADLSVPDAVEASEFFGADGVIITGPATGKPTNLGDLAAARAATSLPVLVGSGAAPDQLAMLFESANAVIVGSWIKQSGVWSNPVDPARCVEMVRAAERARR